MSAAFVKIKADLERHRHLFDLDRDRLGEDLCSAATAGVQECIAGQHAPDGTPWDKLSPAYDEWKSFQFPGEPIAVLYKHMADPHEVAGEVEVAALRAVVTYGISDRAKQEIVWFSEGDADQPPRPFWGFTAASLAEAGKILADRLATA
jgi:hypothetical protein